MNLAPWTFKTAPLPLLLPFFQDREILRTKAPYTHGPYQIFEWGELYVLVWLSRPFISLYSWEVMRGDRLAGTPLADGIKRDPRSAQLKGLAVLRRYC